MQHRLCFLPSLLSLSLDQFNKSVSQNKSSGAFTSDGNIDTALLNFGNAKRLCLFCFMRQMKTHGFTWADPDWIKLMVFKTFADQEWIGLNFFETGLDSDRKLSQSTHVCFACAYGVKSEILLDTRVTCHFQRWQEVRNLQSLCTYYFSSKILQNFGCIDGIQSL